MCHENWTFRWATGSKLLTISVQENLATYFNLSAELACLMRRLLAGDKTDNTSGGEESQADVN